MFKKKIKVKRDNKDNEIKSAIVEYDLYFQYVYYCPSCKEEINKDFYYCPYCRQEIKIDE